MKNIYMVKRVTSPFNIHYTGHQFELVKKGKISEMKKNACAIEYSSKAKQTFALIYSKTVKADTSSTIRVKL